MAEAAVMCWVGTLAGQAGAMGVEPGLIRALAAGRVRRAAACRDWGRGHGGVVDALIDAEFATRRGESSLADLVELAARVDVDAGDDAVVRWWAGALVAERCGLDLDIAGAARAASLLAEVPDDTVAPVLVLWIRGRLRRLDGLVRLFGRDPDRGGSRRLRSLAIADFGRGGLQAEVAATRILGAAAEALWLMEDLERNVAAAVDARAMVGADSAWAPLLDVVLAMLAIGAGEFSMAERSLAIQRESRPASTLGAAAPVLRAMCALAGSAASPVAVPALAETATDLHATDPLGGHRIRLVAASGLLDLGQATAARQLALPVMDLPAMDEIDELERDLFRLRLGLHAGEEVPVDAVTAALDRFAEIGHHSRMANAARRLAKDLALVGRNADVANVCARAAVAPFDPRSEPSGRRAPAAPRATAARVRVMAPAVTVEVSGQRRHLRTTAARLLLALVLAHPAPLAAEAAASALWPEGTWDGDRRRRLNTVVHRLRQGLGDAGAAVGRVGDLLILDPQGWDVDLFGLRRALAARPTAGGTASSLTDALAVVSGNLANAQFPYDEQLVDERHALAAAVLRRLDADETPGVHQYAGTEALRALGVSPS